VRPLRLGESRATLDTENPVCRLYSCESAARPSAAKKRLGRGEVTDRAKRAWRSRRPHIASNTMDTTTAIGTLNTTMTAMTSPRKLVCHYNPGMVAAAFAVSLLGAFTSTQLMCQARGARTLSGVLIWTGLGSLVFGFCGTWCLHFLGMLSCGFDVPIGLNAPLTILSAVLAVTFTFGALSTDLIQRRWQRLRRKRVSFRRHRSETIDRQLGSDVEIRQSSEPLLDSSQKLSRTRSDPESVNNTVAGPPHHLQLAHSRNETSSTDALLADLGADHVVFKRSETLPGYEQIPLFLHAHYI
jgi:hypothetical protein